MTEYLIIAVCILALCLPAAALTAFQMGTRCGERIQKPESGPVKGTAIHWEDSEEQRRTNIVHDNIENYGTACPQKEVK